MASFFLNQMMQKEVTLPPTIFFCAEKTQPNTHGNNGFFAGYLATAVLAYLAFGFHLTGFLPDNLQQEAHTPAPRRSTERPFWGRLSRYP